MASVVGLLLIFTWVVGLVLGSIAFVQYGNKHWGWTW